MVSFGTVRRRRAGWLPLNIMPTGGTGGTSPAVRPSSADGLRVLETSVGYDVNMTLNDITRNLKNVTINSRMLMFIRDKLVYLR